MVSDLDVRNTLSDGLDNTTACKNMFQLEPSDESSHTPTFMSKNGREDALGILAGQRVCVRVTNTGAVMTRKTVRRGHLRNLGLDLLENLNSDFMSLRRQDLDILDAEGLLGLPGDSRFTVDNLGRGWRRQ